MSAQEKQGNATPHGARLVFGIFMIIIYVGVGVLCSRVHIVSGIPK